MIHVRPDGGSRVSGGVGEEEANPSNLLASVPLPSSRRTDRSRGPFDAFLSLALWGRLNGSASIPPPHPLSYRI